MTQTRLILLAEGRDAARLYAALDAEFEDDARPQGNLHLRRP
jgi:hypothetical protein